MIYLLKITLRKVKRKNYLWFLCRGGPVDACRLEGYPSPLFFEPGGTPFLFCARAG